MIAQAVSASARAWAVRDDRPPDVHDIFAQTPWRLEDFVYVPEPDPPEDGIIRVNPDPNVDFANPEYVRSLRGSGVSQTSPLHPICGGAQFAASAAERPSRIFGDAETGQPTRFQNNEVGANAGVTHGSVVETACGVAKSKRRRGAKKKKHEPSDAASTSFR